MGKIVATKQLEGVTLTCEVVKPPVSDPYYCGYATFNERPLEHYGFDGVIEYVPVHGGVTYARSNTDGRVYGFHCDHPGDDQDLDCLRKAWVLEEAERMALSIIALGAIEKQIVAAMNEIWGDSCC